MTETAIFRLNYQLVNHRRNRFLHEPIDIAGEVWNYCVGYQQWAYKFFGKYIHKYDMMRHVGALRRDVAAFQHWQQLNLWAAQEICDRVHKAYMQFFKGDSELPHRHRIKDQRSFVLRIDELRHGRGNGDGVKILDWGENGYGKIRITIGKTRHVFKFHMDKRPLTGWLKYVSIVRQGDGKFFLSFVVQQEQPRVFYPSTGKIGGFDFGLPHFLTNDDGETIDSPQHLFQELDELRRRSRKLSGKTIGSGGWKRAKLDVSRLQAKITNRRSDFHWKLAHNLCRRYDILVFETLNLDGIRRGWKWGRKVSDLALSKFLLKLEWVATKTGRQVIYVEQGYASTKTCSHCGCKKAIMPIRQRVFECSHCGAVMDRDHNAARNLAAKGRGSVPGESGVRLTANAGATALTTKPSA